MQPTRAHPLTSDKYTLFLDASRLGALVPSNPKTPIDNLREQFATQGYLWLQGILDRDKVLACRARYFEAMRGTDSVCSSWIPLGDIPVEMGGLVYLENSHHVGREMEAEFARKSADLPCDEQISAYNKYMTKQAG